MRENSWGAGERFKAHDGSASCMAFSSGRPPCAWPLTEGLINPPARRQALDPPHHRQAALWTHPARGHSPIILKVSHHKWHGRHLCPHLEKGSTDQPQCRELARLPVADPRPHLFIYTSLSWHIQILWNFCERRWMKNTMSAEIMKIFWDFGRAPHSFKEWLFSCSCLSTVFKSMSNLTPDTLTSTLPSTHRTASFTDHPA